MVYHIGVLTGWWHALIDGSHLGFSAVLAGVLWRYTSVERQGNGRMRFATIIIKLSVQSLNWMDRENSCPDARTCPTWSWHFHF
jgi:hypothetical protein